MTIYYEKPFFPKTRDETSEEVQLYLLLQSLILSIYEKRIPKICTNHKYIKNHFNQRHLFPTLLGSRVALLFPAISGVFQGTQKARAATPRAARRARSLTGAEGDDHLANITYIERGKNLIKPCKTI